MLPSRRYLLSIALLIANAGLVRPAEIGVKDLFGDFEEASLVNPTRVGPNSFVIETQSNQIYGNQGSLMTWAMAAIRLSGAQINGGEVVHIHVANGNKMADLHAVYGYDRVKWMPVPTRRSSFDFDVPLEPGHEAVYFATFYPYSYSQMLAHNKRIANSQYAKVAPMGKSVHGRDIFAATITDPKVPDERKRRAFLLAGTHGAETASIYGVEGMLDFLISEDPLAVEMRRSAVWRIIPLHNVDAAAEGLDRRSAGGINLYFDWGFHDENLVRKVKYPPKGPADPAISTTDFSQPETRAAFQSIQEFKPQAFLDVHSWHFAGDGYWGPDPAANSAAVTALKNSIAKYFKIQHWNHEEYPFASAPTIVRKLNIGATLPEFALCYDSDKNLKTPDSMRRQGVGILRGAWEYLKGL